MKKIALIVAMAMLVCWLPGQVLADTLIDWTLNGVTLSGGGSATGDFTYDATTQKITSWNITANQGTSVLSGTTNPYTFSASAFVSVSNALPGGEITFESTGNWPLYDLQLFTSGAFSALAAPGSLTLKNTSFYQVGNGPPNYNFDTHSLTGGALTGTTVPLPPSAFLLGSGLIPLVWTRRKKLLGC